MSNENQLLTGILSVVQAGQILAVEPIAVQRLIALGELPDNRNAAGSVVMKSDLEAYIGRGAPQLTMPPIETGWLAGRRGFVSVTSFKNSMVNLADGLVDVSPEQLAKAAERSPHAREYTFRVKPTAAMKRAYGDDAGRQFGSNINGISYGVAAIVPLLLDGVHSELVKIRQNQLTAPLWKLYANPTAFAAYVAGPRSAIENRLRINIKTSQPVDGRNVTVNRFIELADLSDDPDNDFILAGNFAF